MSGNMIRSCLLFAVGPSIELSSLPGPHPSGSTGFVLITATLNPAGLSPPKDYRISARVPGWPGAYSFALPVSGESRSLEMAAMVDFCLQTIEARPETHPSTLRVTKEVELSHFTDTTTSTKTKPPSPEQGHSYH